MAASNSPSYYDRLVAQDFDQAYKKGFIRTIIKHFSQKRHGLVSFADLRKQLAILGQRDRGMQEIEIEKIIGSFNRYQDFDDSFLPIQTHTRGRWENIDRVYMQGEYLPPVEVYQIGEFYFVIDGNHRISVAREKGQKFIDAHVIELEIPFELQGEFDWYDVLLKQEHQDFYERTGLKKIRPNVEINLSLLGQYTKLLDHISVHRYYTGEFLQREVDFSEAVGSWYDHIYAPMIEIIRKYHILEHFPKRTEADLYLWIIEHLAFLKSTHKKEITFEEAARHFRQSRMNLRIQQIFREIKKFLGKTE